MKEKTKNGNKIKVFDRVEWSITYLKQAGLINRTRRSHYIIAEPGNALLETGISEITSRYLYNNYQSFRDFQNRTRSGGKSLPTSTPNISTVTHNNGSATLKEYKKLLSIIEQSRQIGIEPSSDYFERLAELENKLQYETIAKCDFSSFAALRSSISQPISFIISIDPLSGVSCKVVSTNSVKDIAGQEVVVETNGGKTDKPRRKRRPNWDFYNIGLIDGDIIEYLPDPTQRATVISAKGVTYEDEEFSSLESLTQFLKDSDNGLDALKLWNFDGKRLIDLYDEIFPKENI